MSCSCLPTNTNVQSRWKFQSRNEIPPKTDSWAHRKENILLAINPSSAFSKDISRNN